MSSSTVNLTVRVDERTKKDFDTFCDNVGLNATSAVNLFIKAVVRTRTLPFTITDTSTNEQTIMANMKQSIEAMRQKSIISGNSDMSLDEINAERRIY